MTETRKLTPEELEQKLRPLLDEVRGRLSSLSGTDPELLFALRRKLAKELVYDERDKPAKRSRLKRKKRKEQGGKCAHCGMNLPERGAVLDRLAAMNGYSPENTRLLCPKCDLEAQGHRDYQ